MKLIFILPFLALIPFQNKLNKPPAANRILVYIIKPSASMFEWTGMKTLGQHSGNISVSSGELKYDNGIIKSGKITVDMNSITCTDIHDHSDNQKLISHLKNEDFFNTKEFPQAMFDLTGPSKKISIDSIQVKGILTIKGIKNELIINLAMRQQESILQLNGVAHIDRTKYGIRYKSKTFFPDLGDKFIYDVFDLRLIITAAK